MGNLSLSKFNTFQFLDDSWHLVNIWISLGGQLSLLLVGIVRSLGSLRSHWFHGSSWPSLPLSCTAPPHQNSSFNSDLSSFCRLCPVWLRKLSQKPGNPGRSGSPGHIGLPTSSWCSPTHPTLFTCYIIQTLIHPALVCLMENTQD